MLRRYPSVFLLTAVILGVATADYLALPSWWWLLPAIAGGCISGIAMTRGRLASATMAVAITAAALAAFHFAIRYVDTGADSIRGIAELRRTYLVYGTVDDWPDVRPYRTEIRIAVDSVTGDMVRRVRGGLLLKVAEPTTALQRGDRVAFQTRIYPLPPPGYGDLDYGRFLNLKGVGGIAYLPTLLTVRVDRRTEVGWFGLIDRLRTGITEMLNSTLSPPCAALAAGFLIGQTRDIPPDVYEMFRDTGTLHLLAVSGSNVALVLAFCLLLMWPLGWSYGRRSVVLLVVIVLFAGLCCGEPSVIRASLMAALVISARLIGRLYDLNNVIALAALIILAVDPAQLYDVGFQLSFVTAWGLVFVVPRLTPFFKLVQGRWWYRYGVFPLMVVLVAQVCSTPIVAYYFDRIPVVSVPANVLVVPAVSGAVLGVMALLVVGVIWPLLGLWVGSLVDLWLRGVIGLLTWFGGPDAPVVSGARVFGGAWGAAAVVAAYVLLVLAACSLQSRLARRLAVIVTLVCANAALAASLFATRGSQEPGLEVQRVPGGVAALVRLTPGQEADLVISGLSRVSYAVDDRVLSPMLQERGVVRLRRLFLLGADYGALDDVLRLGRRWRADTVYIPKDLQGAADDLHRARGLMDTGPPVVAQFDGSPSSAPTDGYYLSQGLLRLSVGGQHVFFVADFRATVLPESLVIDSATLVLGGAWEVGGNGGDRTRFATIICSRIEQAESGEYTDRELVSCETPPATVVDLSRVGQYRLALRNPLRK